MFRGSSVVSMVCRSVAIARETRAFTARALHRRITPVCSSERSS